MTRPFRLAAAAAFGLTAAVAAPAQDAPSREAVGTTSEELLGAVTTNAIGEPISYPTGSPQVSAWLVTFEPGGHTNLHVHPVPLVVYVLEGELEVRVAEGEPYSILEGQAIVEPQNRAVQAFNVADGPTRIFVAAMAGEGEPPSVAVEP